MLSDEQGAAGTAGACAPVAQRCHEQGEEMTKAELVEIIANETGVSKKDTGTIVNMILDNISRALETSDKVELRGFGSFKVKSRRARTARNPRSGDSVMVPAKLVPYFKASNELKARLNDQSAGE